AGRAGGNGGLRDLDPLASPGVRMVWNHHLAQGPDHSSALLCLALGDVFAIIQSVFVFSVLTMTIVRPMQRSVSIFVTLGFAAVIGGAALIQSAAELGRRERPQALDVFDRPPTARNLHAFERELEDASLLAGWLRPWTQEAQFLLFAAAG